jgi:hypothetical protein
VLQYATGGDYRIRCVIGSVYRGWIGGEDVGVVRIVHADYLHGDGWTTVVRHET